MRPEDIEQREFGSALRGFDKAEVRAFLRRVAAEVRYLEGEVAAGAAASMPDAIVADPEPPLSERLVGEVAFPPIDAVVGDVPAPPVAPALVAVPPAPPAPQLGVDTDFSPDRFAALGDRIANLLRNAQETAEQLRHQAEADASAIRYAADDYAAGTRYAADAYAAEVHDQADATLAQAQAEAVEIRDHANADAAETRSMASAELEAARAQVSELRSSAEVEAQELRTRAVADAQTSMAGREAVIAEQEALVAAERERAMAELADARGQVATLLQEARAQSEFIRQESEEIIRTKVRANMEQAQRRIDILRTTETASKDRIAAARRELEGALAKLEAEPVPGLAEGTEDEVLAEAQGRATEIAPPTQPSVPEQPGASNLFSDPPEGLTPNGGAGGYVDVVEVDVVDPVTGRAGHLDSDPPLPDEVAESVAPSTDALSNEELDDVHTPENEDVLAKLVREAMQRAVDTARGNEA